MALESWNGLRLGLMALGYQQVIWTHLHCVDHGAFKVGIPDEEMDAYPPECRATCKVNFVAQGFTRYELPAPEKMCKHLSARTRQELWPSRGSPSRGASPTGTRRKSAEGSWSIYPLGILVPGPAA